MTRVVSGLRKRSQSGPAAVPSTQDWPTEVSRAVGRPPVRLSEHALDGARAWLTQRALWERKFDVVEPYLAGSRPTSDPAAP